MSKELEALEKIWQKLVDKAPIDELQPYIKNYKELEKALTPPTKEEICKALSDFLKIEVVFEDGYLLYHWNFNGVAGLACIVKYDYWLGFVIFYEWNLPPHIITMIGRFYESKCKNERHK